VLIPRIQKQWNHVLWAHNHYKGKKHFFKKLRALVSQKQKISYREIQKMMVWALQSVILPIEQ
jgi:hypothetical protein